MAKRNIFILVTLLIILLALLIIAQLNKSEVICWPACEPKINQPPVVSTSSGPIIRNDGSNFRNLSVKAGDTISSPLVITGEVSDGWFFEASFPVVLVNWDGLIIGEGLATAKGDWMTADYVPFEATLEFSKPANPTNQDFLKRGAIIFQKDNPSGLPQFDAAYELPISF